MTAQHEAAVEWLAEPIRARTKPMCHECIADDDWCDCSTCDAVVALTALRASLAKGGPEAEQVAAALGLTVESDAYAGRRPHRFPSAAIGEEVLAWKCTACGEMVREYGSDERTECSVDWRSKGKRRVVGPWVEVPS